MASEETVVMEPVDDEPAAEEKPELTLEQVVAVLEQKLGLDFYEELVPNPESEAILAPNILPGSPDDPNAEGEGEDASAAGEGEASAPPAAGAPRAEWDAYAESIGIEGAASLGSKADVQDAVEAEQA